jgi:hypothetical protein
MGIAIKPCPSCGDTIDATDPHNCEGPPPAQGKPEPRGNEAKLAANAGYGPKKKNRTR